VINLTDIKFTEHENQLLQKGLKYNLHVQPKQQIKILAIEAETAINLLPVPDQDPVRYLIAKTLDKIAHRTIPNPPDISSKNHKSKFDKITVNKIKEKLKQHNAILTKADKGQSIIIIYNDDYNNKVQDFITNNNFQLASRDPTNTFQKDIKILINSSPTLIAQHSKWKYHNMNPKAPTITGLIKIHKQKTPIRPIVNWTQAPAYKLAKLLSEKLSTELQLPFTFNVRNSPHLIHEIQEIPYNSNLRLASFDVTNMYTNIPTHQLPSIITNICEFQNTQPNLKDEILKVNKALLKQNYFLFQNSIYRQVKGLAMGAPTSAILSEIYRQYIENKTLVDILVKHKILGYFRYVDDILLVYDITTTDINSVVNHFNSIIPSLKFTLENETNNKLNFLDITITRLHDKFDFSIYRKPTTTDHIIPNDSCHPQEHKNSAISFLTNILNTYPLSTKNKSIEKATIQQILHKNKYNYTVLTNNPKSNNTSNSQSATPESKKRAIFTYTGPNTRAITRIFQKAGLLTAFTTKHSIGKLLRPTSNTVDKYNNCGLYQLECGDCGLQYVGQTGRPFRIRYQEHKRDYESNSTKSLFAKHLLDNNHKLQPIEDSMSILCFQQKGRKLNTLEQFHIYKVTKK
jgi:hypothetical protein